MKEIPPSYPPRKRENVGQTGGGRKGIYAFWKEGGRKARPVQRGRYPRRRAKRGGTSFFAARKNCKGRGRYTFGEEKKRVQGYDPEKKETKKGGKRGYLSAARQKKNKETLHNVGGQAEEIHSRERTKKTFRLEKAHLWKGGQEDQFG